MMFMHTVVPNLKNLGLITERTENGWREKGMMSNSSAPSGESIPVAGA